MLAGRYRLGAPLGAGGMARVVEAHDERLDRRVAVKLVAADAVDDAERQRFLDEARAGASFVHPNAVAVYDAGADGGWLFLVMELIDGPTLADVIAQRGALPAHEAASIIDGVLNALAAAHAAGLVHRDVKPGNVLLGPDGSVKLADFGIAKRLDHGHDDLTVAGQFIGTPRYLAPEQLAGERATPASDVYGVGIVLFELLTGRPPFDGEHLMAIALAHRDRPVPPLPRGTPPAVAAVVTTALAKDPGDRYPDAVAMRTALSAAPTADAMAAPQEPPVVPATRVATTPIRPKRRPGQTRRMWQAIAIATMVALLVGLALRACADGGDDLTSLPGSTGAETTLATVVGTAEGAAPTVAVTAPPPVLPSTVADLIAVLTVAPDGFGDVGPELRTRLEELDGLNGKKARDNAGRLVDQVQKWLDEGRLDPEFGGQVLDVVGPLAENPNDGNNGNGNGNGNDDQDDD